VESGAFCANTEYRQEAMPCSISAPLNPSEDFRFKDQREIPGTFKTRILKTNGLTKWSLFQTVTKKWGKKGQKTLIPACIMKITLCNCLVFIHIK
jgi:hypothetical protein